jgi:predicted RNA-binding protein with RPS1 domain
LKLRETRQQYVQELNNLKTERSTMLIKIIDLDKKLLEVQLQIERLTNKKLTHMHFV